jgi:hypothetical protein
MATRLIRLFLFLLLIQGFARTANAAMVRVVEVIDGQTILVDRNGARERIQLDGVTVLRDLDARAFLAWSLPRGTWLMTEPRGGRFDVYRSPDALFVNRELIAHGFARATRPDLAPQETTRATYMGISSPGPAAASQKSTTRAAGSTTKARTTARAKTSSGRSRRSSRAPSPSSRAAGPRTGGSTAKNPPSPPTSSSASPGTGKGDPSPGGSPR